MGICYLLANHTKKEYLSRGEKFSEMNHPYFLKEFLFLLIYVWDLRQPQLLEWIGDNNDQYSVIKKTYYNIEPELVRGMSELTEW